MAAAASLQVPVDAYRFGVELTPAAAAAAHGIGSGGALLVRPDGFVAWRSIGPSPDPTTELRGVLRAILSTPR
jgi:putative polyketide hydroxylase